MTTGYIEVCKQSAPAPLAVTGSFELHDSPLRRQDLQRDRSGGLCSEPIQVAAGTCHDHRRQPGAWYNVISIAGLPGTTYLELPRQLPHGYAYVNVPASTDVSGTAAVTYTNQWIRA